MLYKYKNNVYLLFIFRVHWCIRVDTLNTGTLTEKIN